MRRAPLAVRFWEKVNKDGPLLAGMDSRCWLWTAHRLPSGYGQMYVNRSRGRDTAQRVSWELQRGPIPVGLHVLHRCDNPPCVNPDHLFLGTNLDNITDRETKGRTPHGSAHHAARLTDESVRRIRQLRESMTGRAVAAVFGISDSLVSKILHGKLWRHVA